MPNRVPRLGDFIIPSQLLRRAQPLPARERRPYAQTLVGAT